MKRTDQEIYGWYIEYQQGKTLDELNVLYKTNSEYHFNRLNLVRRNSSENALKRKGRIQIKNYFKTIENEKEAYILGLWFADGNVSNKKSSISLIKEDINLLVSIRDYISPDFKIHFQKNVVTLYVSSVEFTNNLINNGLIPNKTNRNYSIPNIPQNLIRHFIRGYFDGDGTIYYDRNYLRVSICSINPNILIEFQNQLLIDDVTSSINKEIRYGKKLLTSQGVCEVCKDMYRLYVRKKDSLLKLYNFLYQDSTIYLERKHNKFLNYVNTEVNNQITKG